MNGKDIFWGLSYINRRYIDEAERDTVCEHAKVPLGKQSTQQSPVKHSRFPRPLLIAALIAVLLALVGCGIAAVIFGGDSIQEWFGFYWGEITGQDMGADQTAIINKLTQEIGVSDTDGGVTVTIDSATGSANMFYLLVRVEGYSFNKQYQYGFYQYGFNRIQCEIDTQMLPAKLKGGSRSIRYLGVNQDGAGLFLVILCYELSDMGADDLLEPLPMKLTLENLTRRINLKKNKPVKEGQWTFSFSLDRCEIPEKIALPDTLVGGFNEDTGESVPVLLRNIVLSNFDLRYTFDSPQGNITIYPNTSVLLKNGSCIQSWHGSGARSEDRLIFNCTSYWPIPLNIDDIASITIAGTEIKLSGGNTQIYPESVQQNTTTDQTDGNGQVTTPVRNVLTDYYPRQLPEGYSVRDDALIDQSTRSILYRNEAENTVRFSISSQNVFIDAVLAPTVEEKCLSVSGHVATLQISGKGGQVLRWNNDTDGYYAALFTTDLQVDLIAIAESVTPETP